MRAAEGGTFLLRIEDIDPVRCRPEFAQAIEEDLAWLGLTWPSPVRFQSDHGAEYAAALARLRKKGFLYPCFCSRKDIREEALRAGEAPHGTEGSVVYPGTCRQLSGRERDRKLMEKGAVNWRLDVAAALKETGPLWWRDRERGRVEARPEVFGDVVLARKDVPTSYHLSVTVDDQAQGVTLVTRGEDLFLSTHVHRLLQALLGYETPEYAHHRLLVDSSGRRYAKRDHSVTLRELRRLGLSREDVLKIIGT